MRRLGGSHPHPRVPPSQECGYVQKKKATLGALRAVFAVSQFHNKMCSYSITRLTCQSTSVLLCMPPNTWELCMPLRSVGLSIQAVEAIR